ncbi:MAG TPA: hypothetical protein VFH51_03530 [Myxococcota bacterium]|nr:hypothetical protein [Myxococcota bacterium]
MGGAHKRLAGLVLLLTAGCNGLLPGRVAPGTFTVHFAWADARPEGFEGYAFMRIEHRPGGADVAGPTLGTSGPTLFAAGMAMDFEAIPHRDNLVLIVELRESKDRSARVQFFGMSEPFALVAGKNTQVAVRLALLPTPAARTTRDPNAVGDPASSVVSILSDEGRGSVADPNVQLRLLSDRGVRARLANVVGFPQAGTREVVLAGLTQSPAGLDGFSAYLLPWNLDAGLSQTGCVLARGCSRTVFVQLLDASGYPSDVATAEVLLDARAPAVVADASLVSPRSASASSTLVVSVVATEPLLEVPVLTVQGRSDVFTLSSRDGDTTYAFVARQPAGAPWADGAYTVTATLQDWAGNIATGVPVGSFTLDSSLPDAAAGSVTVNPAFLKAGDSLAIAFTATEPLLRAPEVRVGTTLVTGCTESPSGRYTCAVVADPTAGDGLKAVTALLVDGAGNRNTVSLGAV